MRAIGPPASDLTDDRRVAWGRNETPEMDGLLESIARSGGKELLDAVEAEFRTGWERERVETELAEARLAQACSVLESAAEASTGLRVTMDVPAASYFYWIHQGRAVFNEENIWKHEEFRRDYLKKNPQDRVRYRSEKPRVGWTAGMTKPECRMPKASGIVLTDKRGVVL